MSNLILNLSFNLDVFDDVFVLDSYSRYLLAFQSPHLLSLPSFPPIFIPFLASVFLPVPPMSHLFSFSFSRHPPLRGLSSTAHELAWKGDCPCTFTLLYGYAITCVQKGQHACRESVC